MRIGTGLWLAAIALTMAALVWTGSAPEQAQAVAEPTLTISPEYLHQNFDMSRLPVEHTADPF